LNLGFPPRLLFIPDCFKEVSCIINLVHTINIGSSCAQHLDDSDRLETVRIDPIPLDMMRNGIIFQGPVACVPPHVFVSPSGTCAMGSTASTVLLTISPSDLIAGTAHATLTMTFFLVTSAIISGGTTTPSNFFASCVVPVVSVGASSVSSLNIACEAPSRTAVVLATSGATISASATAFTIQKPASSGSNFLFLTGISLSLLVTGFYAQFISLPLVTVQLSAMANLTVRSLQYVAHIDCICQSEMNLIAFSSTELLFFCQVLARICRTLLCIPLLRCAHKRPIRSTMKSRSSFAQHWRINVSEWICTVMALFVALLPDSTLASQSV
jgi:hypothetical protein